MKRYFNVFSILLAIFLITGFFYSCSDNQGGKGTLVISLPGNGTERSALDSNRINDLQLTYDIKCTGPDESFDFKDVKAGSPVLLKVSSGTWSITITVFDAMGIEIGEKTQEEKVMAGERTIVNITIPIDIPVYLRVDSGNNSWTSWKDIKVSDYYNVTLKQNTNYKVNISGYASRAINNMMVGFKDDKDRFITNEYESKQGKKIPKGSFKESFTIKITNSFTDIDVIFLDILNFEAGTADKTIIASITDFNMEVYREVSLNDAVSNFTITGLTQSASYYYVKVFPNNTISSRSDFESKTPIAYGGTVAGNNNKFLLTAESEFGNLVYIWEGTGLYTIVLDLKSSSIDLVRVANDVNFINGVAEINRDSHLTELK